MKFSIIIPVKKLNPLLKQCIEECKKQSDSEIIVIANENFHYRGVKTLILKGTPSDKRDFASKKAKGEFLAFIDDDAYPEKHWLENSLKYFKKNVSAVAGPAVNLENEEVKKKTSGLIFSSILGGGGFAERYKQGVSKEVDDWPSVNFIVRKKNFIEVEGFNTKYWPGEDTILCLKIRKKGWKIIYASDVIVFHHRRALYKEHLKQVFSYGLHRGFFAKKYPENSLKIQYFLPSLMVAGFLAGILLSFFYGWAFELLLVVSFLYILAVLAESLKKSLEEKSLEIFFLFFTGVILTHLIYGISFIKGLASKDLKR